VRELREQLQRDGRRPRHRFDGKVSTEGRLPLRTLARASSPSQHVCGQARHDAFHMVDLEVAALRPALAGGPPPPRLLSFGTRRLARVGYWCRTSLTHRRNGRRPARTAGR
jgi:hypothetical protein